MKFFFGCIAFFAASLGFAGLPESFELKQTVFENADLEFISHQGSDRFGSYLVMDIQFAPVKSLFNVLNRETKPNLKNRGEAHITVLTPIEYFDYLKPLGIKMSQIEKIALNSKIQSSAFDIVCLGQGRKELNGKEESTYFVVVKSDDLLKIRQKIEEVYLQNGGKKDGFKASHFFPHITLGFSKRDLHESDGIYKDERTCVADIKLK